MIKLIIESKGDKGTLSHLETLKILKKIEENSYEYEEYILELSLHGQKLRMVINQQKSLENVQLGSNYIISNI